MNRKAEIKDYQTMLKNNEAEIARLNGVNKHIKTHIKFLQGLGVEEGEIEEHPAYNETTLRHIEENQ